MQFFRLALPFHRSRAVLAGAAFVLAACRTGAARLPFPLPALVADSAHHERVADGLARHAYRLSRIPDDPSAPSVDTIPGPWMVQVLEADRRRCWLPFPYRAGSDPTRAPVRALAHQLLLREPPRSVVGGVNADFFFFAPNGVLQGPHVHRGVVVAGPGDRAAVTLDSAGRLQVARLTTRGIVAAGADTLRIAGWNRWLPTGLAFYDRWHGRIDSVRASVVVEVEWSGGGWYVGRVDSAPPPSMPAPARALLALGRNAPDSLRARLLTVARPGAPLDTVGVAIAPFHPMEAVGGHGVLLRDGGIPAAIDSTGAASFARARHPRSAVGWDSTGRRLLLVTVDGRQPGFSAGMTLRELARTMRALGASDALNLDGGGSTTLVLGRRDADRGPVVRVLNRPSDRENGRVVERPVANALMLARSCPR